jgi:hypothetical protein
MLMAIAFTVSGIAAILAGALARRQWRAQFRWPKAHGTVVVSTVSLSNGYFPEVEYRYVHEGRSYYGIDVNSGAVGRVSRSDVERIIAKYPVGSSVVVFVNPREPHNAVLEPGGDRFYPILFFIIGAIFVLSGTSMLIRG